MKIRIISALVVIAIFIPLIWLGGIPFAIAMGLLSIQAYNEMLSLKKSHNRIPILIKILGLIAVCFITLGNINGYSLTYRQIVLPLILLLLPTVFIPKDKYTTQNAFYLLGSVYLIGFLFHLLIAVRTVNVFILIYLLSITISSDSFAYAIGCLIGKHKMCPKISPKKSWEGAIAGFIGGVIVALLVYSHLVAPITFKVVLVTMILNIAGQIGDLVYSKIKRENEIKDFSNIMPGHGGVLDRLDSLSFVVFMYVLLIWTF